MYRLMEHDYMYKKAFSDSGFQAVNSRLQVLRDSGFLVNLTWISDLISLWDSGFLKLNSGFQSPGFRIFQAKYPGFRNMDYLTWHEMLSREAYYMVLRKQCFHV